MILPKQLNLKYLIFIPLFISVVCFAIAWDLQCLDTDFDHLYSLLKTARSDAIYKETTIIVKFNNASVTVTNQKDSTNRTTTIPMIAKVDYDTTMGNNMIVFTWRGTTEHNKRIHGGEIMLKSLFGFKRFIHVNCNGMVTEGRYSEDL